MKKFNFKINNFYSIFNQMNSDDKNKNLDSFLDGELRGSLRSQPSDDFTAVLMKKVELEKEFAKEDVKAYRIAKYAIGVENIDIEAATERGIVVCNAANYCLEEVSDHTVALLLACARRIVTIAPPCTAGWMARRRIPSPSASLQHLDPWAGRLWKDCTPGRSEAP